MRLLKITTDGWSRMGNVLLSTKFYFLSPPKFSIGGLKMLRFPISLGGRASEAKGWKLENDIKNNLCITLILSLLLFSFSLFADSSSTTLTDLKQIEIFNDVTSRIRCICLPSLPIKSCSFNNCAISAQLKFFIENRIRKGETANEIVQKMQTGFGEEALSDPIIQKLQNSGNENMVSGVVNGFGERILAQPDSTWINLTLFAGMTLGLGLIFYYLKGRLKKTRAESEPQAKSALSADAEKYLKEISG